MTRESSECEVGKLTLSRWGFDAICRALAWQKTDVTLRPELLLLSQTALVMRSLDVLQCLIFCCALSNRSEENIWGSWLLIRNFLTSNPKAAGIFMSFFVSLIPDEHRDSILLLAWPLTSYSLYCYYPLQKYRSHSWVTGNDDAPRDHVIGLAL